MKEQQNQKCQKCNKSWIEEEKREDKILYKCNHCNHAWIQQTLSVLK